MILQIILTFLVALLGAIIALKLKIPAGAMVGSMILVAVFNVMFAKAYFPSNLKIMTQIISGLFIGCKITRSELVSLKKCVKPAIMNTVCILLSCLVMGICLYYFTDYSLATCVFATAPGSIVDMSIISIDMGADTSIVSVLQLVRLISILGLFPTIFGKLIDFLRKKDPNVVSDIKETAPAMQKVTIQKNKKNICITLLVAIACGVIGYSLGVPAGALIFSMTGVAIQNVTTSTAYMPLRFKQFAQVCAGALIGESVTRASITNLHTAIIPAVILLVGLFTIVVVLAYILYKTSDVDFVTALFSCAPGGASDLALIAEDFGANTPKVSIIQSLRVICVVIFYPLAIQFLARVL